MLLIHCNQLEELRFSIYPCLEDKLEHAVYKFCVSLYACLFSLLIKYWAIKSPYQGM